MVTVFNARKVITMDRNCPIASHVAVENGVILAVGGPDCGEIQLTRDREVPSRDWSYP